MKTNSNCTLQPSESFIKGIFQIKSLEMSVQENNLEIKIKSPHLRSNFYPASIVDNQLVLKVYHLNSSKKNSIVSVNPIFLTHFLSLPSNDYDTILHQEIIDSVLYLTLGIKNKNQSIPQLHYSGVA